MKDRCCALAGLQNERVALCDVAVCATLHDLLGEVTVSQTYRNDEQRPIEAVYTFPLASDAVLLDLTVTIGGRTLTGHVVERRAAEERYEDAITTGDAAVMLQQLEGGLYTMNVGNLLPGELATIVFRYATVYRWSGDRLRFHLPTTIAPRYGASMHAPHQEPAHSLSVENRFSLSVAIRGALRSAQFESPTHAVTLSQGEDETTIALQQVRAVMDRDFVLVVRSPESTRAFASCGSDGEGTAAIASFQPFFPGLHQPRPINVAIVIDCSGSMQGDSITMAKRAVDQILSSLKPNDRANVVAFGNVARLFSRDLFPCAPRAIAEARRHVASLNADLGGTEIGQALRQTYHSMSDHLASNVFVVTDGEVNAWEPIVEEAKRSGHRLFTVGVGSAVSEAFVRALASETGGACELVTPGEDMSERIVRHFERMRAPRARRVSVRWPQGAYDMAPAVPNAVYEGDTLVATARFASPLADGSVMLEVETDTGSVLHQELPLVATSSARSADRLSTVARLAAAMRLPSLSGRAAVETAVRYRLVSPYTNWLVIAARAEGEQSMELPVLRKVPQTMAAGWGGMGSVMDMAAPRRARMSPRFSSMMELGENYAAPSPMPHFDEPMSPSASPAPPEQAMPGSSGSSDLLDALRDITQRLRSIALPSPMRPRPPRGTPPKSESIPTLGEGSSSFARLIALVDADPTQVHPQTALSLLQLAGFGDAVADVYREACDAGIAPDVVALALLASLLEPSLDRLSMHNRRGVSRRLKQHTGRYVSAFRELQSGHGRLLAAAEIMLALGGASPAGSVDLGEVKAWRRDELPRIVSAWMQVEVWGRGVVRGEGVRA